MLLLFCVCVCACVCFNWPFSPLKGKLFSHASKGTTTMSTHMHCCLGVLISGFSGESRTNALHFDKHMISWLMFVTRVKLISLVCNNNKIRRNADHTDVINRQRADNTLKTCLILKHFSVFFTSCRGSLAVCYSHCYLWHTVLWDLIVFAVAATYSWHALLTNASRNPIKQCVSIRMEAPL